MTLGPHDQHWLFERDAGLIECWDSSHQRIFQAEARNRTTNDGSFGHDGWLPYGEFVFGHPVAKNIPSMGPFFVPILDAPGHNELASRVRSGLGWHGGGSGLPNPLADYQSPPWVVTHGCIRSVNHFLKIGVALIGKAQALGGVCYLTNVFPIPGAMAADGSDYLDVDESTLDLEE
jgi:hypothetical protein